MKRAPFSGLLAALALTLAVPSLVGCGPAPSGVQLAKVQAGSLPAGETFKGVWYNPVFGDLHMVPQGNAIVGKFKSQSSGVWGKVHGEISGDLIKFEWEEHKTGAIGPGSTRKGKGYFKFVPKEAPEQPALRGEWGLGDNEVGGGDWDCIRQKDVEPKLESIGGEADPTIGAGWDAEPTPPSGQGSGSKTPPPKKLGRVAWREWSHEGLRGDRPVHKQGRPSRPWPSRESDEREASGQVGFQVPHARVPQLQERRAHAAP